jgi:hypothetical protein
MALETWYRGTATGSQPASPGTYSHDLLEGLYLTDKLDVAYSYAGTRTTNSDEQLPYVSWGKFDPAARGNVLDLTSGAHQQKWTEFESRVLPSEGITFRAVMARGGGNYGRMFKMFLTENKINVDSYDILIGPEYIRGGRQMCIRKPAVASQIENIMVPGAPPKSGGPGLGPGTPMSFAPGPTPGRGQANAGAMFALFQIVDMWLSYENDKFLAEDVGNALKMEATKVRDWQSRTPTDGALIALTFSRVVPDSAIMQKTVLLHPGDKFEYVDSYFAETPEKAADLLAHEREARSGGGDGPYKTVWRKQLSWIQPRLRRVAGPVMNSPVGWWRVQVGKWTWFYEFDAQGGVRWTDPFSNATGRGTWKLTNDCLVTSWAPGSSTTEEWHLPLNAEAQTGKCVMVQGVFALKAVGGVEPPPNVLNPPVSSPVGKWRVQVSKWTWVYEFDASGSVRWTDPQSNMTGKGTWKMTAGRLLTAWAPASKTTEEWNLPLGSNNQTGKCFMQEGTFPLKAAKI